VAAFLLGVFRLGTVAAFLLDFLAIAAAFFVVAVVDAASVVAQY